MDLHLLRLNDCIERIKLSCHGFWMASCQNQRQNNTDAFLLFVRFNGQQCHELPE